MMNQSCLHNGTSRNTPKGQGSENLGVEHAEVLGGRCDRRRHGISDPSPMLCLTHLFHRLLLLSCIFYNKPVNVNSAFLSSESHSSELSNPKKGVMGTPEFITGQSEAQGLVTSRGMGAGAVGGTEAPPWGSALALGSVGIELWNIQSVSQSWLLSERTSEAILLFGGQRYSIFTLISKEKAIFGL